jgi:hypothetical protein
MEALASYGEDTAHAADPGQVDALLRDGLRDGNVASALIRIGARRIAQELLQTEQRDSLGRERYERRHDTRHRNGYERAAMKTAEGSVELAAPQVRGNSDVLEKLTAEMYTRGVPTRDWVAAAGARWKSNRVHLGGPEVPARGRDDRRLARLTRVNGYAPRLELLRVALVFAAGEDIDLVRHDDVREAGLLEKHAPLCIQQSTGYSAAP